VGDYAFDPDFEAILPVLPTVIEVLKRRLRD